MEACKEVNHYKVDKRDLVSDHHLGVLQHERMRLQMCILIPDAPSCRAISYPIPDPPPVMKATYIRIRALASGASRRV